MYHIILIYSSVEGKHILYEHSNKLRVVILLSIFQPLSESTPILLRNQWEAELGKQQNTKCQYKQKLMQYLESKMNANGRRHSELLCEGRFLIFFEIIVSPGECCREHQVESALQMKGPCEVLYIIVLVVKFY